MTVQECAVGAFFVFEEVCVADFLDCGVLTACEFVIDYD